MRNLIKYSSSWKISDLLISCFLNGGTLLIFGCGGLAAESSHMAAEFVCKFKRKRRHLPAIALTVDPAIITAISNDYGFDQVFSIQLEALGKRGDMAIGMSTSGKSPSVINGLKQAEKMGMTTLDLPREGKNTAEIQENQLKLIHQICDEVDQYFEEKL